MQHATQTVRARDHDKGLLSASSWLSQRMACVLLSPHISADGARLPHTAGRSGLPNSRQRLSVLNCTQRTPAGLPCGMPGMAEEMEGAMQQAAQCKRQSIRYPLIYPLHQGQRRLYQADQLLAPTARTDMADL